MKVNSRVPFYSLKEVSKRPNNVFDLIDNINVRRGLAERLKDKKQAEKVVAMWNIVMQRRGADRRGREEKEEGTGKGRKEEKRHAEG